MLTTVKCFIAILYTAVSLLMVLIGPENLEAKTDNLPKEVFVTQQIVKDHLRIYQQTLYSVRFYRHIKTINAELAKPAMADFEFIDLGIEKEYSQAIGPHQYLVTELQYVALAKSTGTFMMPSARVEFETITSSFGTLDHGVSSKRQRKIVTSDPLEVIVLPLPDTVITEVPVTLVGDFSISSRIGDHSMTLEEAVTLTVTIQGTGNLHAPVALSIPEIPACRIIQAPPAYDLRKTPSGISGTQVHKMAIIPRAAGEYVVAPLALKFFSPKENTYQTIETTALKLKVASTEILQPAFSHSSDPDKSGNIRINNRLGAWFWPVTGLIMTGTIILGILLYRRRSGRPVPQQGDLEQLESINKDLVSRQGVGPGDLNTLVRSALTLRIGIECGCLTTGEINHHLQAASLSKDLISAITALMNTLDCERFADGSTWQATMDDRKAHCVRIIASILSWDKGRGPSN